MKQIILACALCALPVTAPAQTAEVEEPGLIEQGINLLFQGFMEEAAPAIDDMAAAMDKLGPAMAQLTALIDDLTNYEAPRMLENGDILIPRKPDAPAPAPQGETEL